MLTKYTMYNNNLHSKRMLYYQRSSFSWLELNASKDRRVIAQYTRRGGFSVCHFVRNYTHNSISKGGIRTFYLSNDCSTIREIYCLG